MGQCNNIVSSSLTPAASELIDRFQRGDDGGRRYGARFVVDRFPIGTCRFGNNSQIFVAYVGNADICEGCRQANRFAEVVDLVDNLARPIRQKEPSQHAYRHFFAMEETMRCL